MYKWLKRISIVVISIILILVVAGVLLVTYVNPNRFKSVIEQQVYRTTGRTLTLRGDLHWTFFPSIGLSFEDADLSNIENFDSKKFVTVDRAKISVKLVPLLNKKIEVNNLLVDGLTLNLVKDRRGVKNWEDLISLGKDKNGVKDKETQKTEKKFEWVLPQINLKNVTIQYSDLSTGRKTEISHLNFETTHVQDQVPFPIKLSLRIPPLKGQIVLTSDLHIRPQKKDYQLRDLVLSAQLEGSSLPSGKLDAKLRGDVSLTSNQLRAKSLQLKLNESNIVGSLIIDDLSSWKGQFNVTTDYLNVNQFLTPSKQKGKTIQSAQASKNSLNKILRQLNLTGKFEIGQLVVKNLQAKQIKAKAKLSNGVATFSPITAVFYGGTVDGIINIDGKQTTSRVSLKGKLKNIKVQPLLKDLSGYENIVGIGNLDVNLSSYGFNPSGLNGQMTFNINHGTLKGINAAYFMQLGRALLKKQTISFPKGPRRTDFDSLTGTASITKGILSNDDLYLSSEELEGKGKGKIDLVKQYMDYRLEVNPINDKNFIVPIDIKGPFSSLKVGLDENRLLWMATKRQLKKHQEKIIKQGEILEEKLKSKLKDLLN